MFKKIFTMLITTLQVVLVLFPVVSNANQSYISKLNYLSYLQIGSSSHFIRGQGYNGEAISTDLFIPLWQSENRLFFTDLRMLDRSGAELEGNFHLGYRHLLSEKQLYGIYAVFDSKQSKLHNHFNQLTVGAEYWYKKIFVSGNFYYPIGKSSKVIWLPETVELDSAQKYIWITKNSKNETALTGGDAEVGYDLAKGLTGYAGGYYFKATDVDPIYGPKVRLTYDWFLDNGKRILGVFDKFGLEGGVQKDKVRGLTAYVGANLRIGLSPNSRANLQGLSRHMVDPIRRDFDIISTTSTKTIKEIYREKGKIVKLQRVADVKDVGQTEDGQYIYKKVSGNTFSFKSGRLHKLDISKLEPTKRFFSDSRHRHYTKKNGNDTIKTDSGNQNKATPDSDTNKNTITPIEELHYWSWGQKSYTEESSAKSWWDWLF